MTLPSEGRKLDNEINSIENAVREGIQQIHPDKMEAFAEHLVDKLKGAENIGELVVLLKSEINPLDFNS